MATKVGVPAQAAVTVVYSDAPRMVQEIVLQVPLGCLVAEVLALAAPHLGISMADVHLLDTGVWGKKVTKLYAVRDTDRLELYRPLTVDPKVARRERFVRQGAKSAGLFATRRAGGKAGY